ncbi:MAG: YvaD family protein [Hyphomonadaceae bacterium]|nr:YvaD family protein [Hyphomonadaceae bacterium]
MTYWAVALLALFNVFQLPPDLMYGDYTDPRVSAWNWSFFPLDLAFSVFGYLAVSAARRQAPVWRSYAIISLILTMTAGGMAVAYWAILREFDPSWFLPNLVIFAWPVFFLPGLIKGTAN